VSVVVECGREAKSSCFKSPDLSADPKVVVVGEEGEGKRDIKMHLLHI
jgi:hypothetical protein